MTALALCLLAGGAATPAASSPASWIAVGPEGGDVRSLAVDPRNESRIYLGTAGGALYRSDTSGLSWRRLAPGLPRPGQTLDEIVVSPTGALFVAYWDVHARGGGVARSSDGGETFTLGLEGESVRALRLAPSDPNVLVAGSLTGVFRSIDGGETWQRITPPNHPELLNVESVAIDPRDPRVIYVGTWHLPWKTTNGGVTWKPVPRGMIEDSDVFSLTLDRRDPNRIFATACSGIYRTPDGAGLWSRVRGMPFGSRRTRAFAQDLDRHGTFYAGTTQGFFVSTDDAAAWRATTPLDVVVNAVAPLSNGVVLAGIEGAGVLRSLDHGETWTPSNTGFSERFVSRLAFDPSSGRILASVFGDRIYGGVFEAPSARAPWTRLGEGLKGRDVLSLAMAGPRSFAGTDQGLFVLASATPRWQRLILPGEPARPHPRVNDLATLRGATILAATSSGVFRSEDAGVGWVRLLPNEGEATALLLSPSGELSMVATGLGLFTSLDEGRTWSAMAKDKSGPSRVHALAVAGGMRPIILAATTFGLYRSTDRGATWSRGAHGLPDSDYTSLAVAPDGGPIFVSDFAWGGVYRSNDHGESWTRLSDDGLATNRAWTLGIDVRAPDELLAGSSAGGLHLLNWK